MEKKKRLEIGHERIISGELGATGATFTVLELKGRCEWSGEFGVGGFAIG